MSGDENFSGRIKCLDGWRALSIFLVVFSHSHIVSMAGDLGRSGGSYGVRFFFVISGFLITLLMLKEINLTGKISLKNFYIRRLLRIFPVYFAYIIVCLLLETSGVANKVTNSHQWLLNIIFLANYGECTGPTGVLWSLGVEEQFYLIWPLLFVRFNLMNKKVLPVLLLACAIIIAPVFRGLTITKKLDDWTILSHRFSFLHHMDMLAIGCLGAIIIWRNPKISSLFVTKWRLVLPLSIMLLTIPYAARNIQGLGIETVFGPTMQAFGFLLLLVLSISYPSLIYFKPLQYAPVVWLGTISYSLYLWHSVFLTGRYFGDGENLLIYIGFPVSLCVAALSYYFLELPIMGMRSRYRINKNKKDIT